MQRLELPSGHEMAYADDGEGHPIVFVHGGFMSHRVWDAQRFAFDDYRVVRVDLLGHGASEKPDVDYTPALYADHLQELLAHLDLEAATLVGWSLGATTAVTHVGRHGDRVRDLVLVCSGIFRWMLADPEAAEAGIDLDGLLDAMVADHPAMMRNFVEGLFAADVSRATVDRFWQIAMQQPLHVAHDVLNIYVDADYDRLRGTVEGIEIPTAVFQGGEDTAATLDQAATVADDLLPDGRFEPFEASGHVPFVEERERFDRALRSFVER